MKKNIIYLAAFISLAFAACNPLKDEINNIKPAASKDLTITLASTDYSVLPTGNYAKTGFYFATVADANTNIPVILNLKYPHLGDGSKAFVTYNTLPAQIKPIDSLLSTVATPPTQYTVTDADYLAINGNAFKNFTLAKVTQFLDAKFPTKVENQLIVVSYVYFESGVTTSAGVSVVETFLYMNGAWTRVYHVSQAQYISAGKMTVFNFAAADEPNLNGYFNTFLKSDASVAAKSKVGDVKYVSFAYFASSKTYQRIRTLIFDGTNWGYKSIPSTPLTFIKKGGKWIPDPTVYYTLIKAEYIVLKSAEAIAAKIGTDLGRVNAADFGSFDIRATSANTWTDAQINDALSFILKGKYASAPVDETIFYKITYTIYNGTTSMTDKTFVKTATGFVFVPKPG